MGAGYRFIAKKDKKAADILIYENVGAGWFGGVTAEEIHEDIKAAGKVEQLDVRIASYGGDVNDGMAIYRLLAEFDGRVVTHCDGVAASIASVIFMAGAERVIAESGSVMIHDAWTIAGGNAADFRRLADNMDKTSTQIAEVYAARCKKPVSDVRALMTAETWMYGQEVIDKGFADSLAKNVEAAHSGQLWQSVMQSRIAQRIHLDRGAAPPLAGRPDPEADELRSKVMNQRARVLARGVMSTRGAG